MWCFESSLYHSSGIIEYYAIQSFLLFYKSLFNFLSMSSSSLKCYLSFSFAIIGADSSEIIDIRDSTLYFAFTDVTDNSRLSNICTSEVNTTP